MPVVFIEAPSGIRAHAKKKMVEKVTSAIDEIYQVGGSLVLLRENAPENAAMDGHLQSDPPKNPGSSRKNRERAITSTQKTP